MIKNDLARRALCFAAAASLSLGALGADITGAGATFPYPIYAKWADAYKKATGVGLNYQSIGSGGGIKQITAKTVDFGASDMPMKPEELDKNGLMQFPAVMGGDVMVYNLKGIPSGAITLAGPMIADIYLGKIRKWNDPVLAKQNPGTRLPDSDPRNALASPAAGDRPAGTAHQPRRAIPSAAASS